MDPGQVGVETVLKEVAKLRQIRALGLRVFGAIMLLRPGSPMMHELKGGKYYELWNAQAQYYNDRVSGV